MDFSERVSRMVTNSLGVDADAELAPELEVAADEPEEEEEVARPPSNRGPGLRPQPHHSLPHQHRTTAALIGPSTNRLTPAVLSQVEEEEDEDASGDKDEM